MSLRLFTLAVGALVAGAAPIGAQQVRYYTIGTFSASGTSTLKLGPGVDSPVLTFLGGSADNPLMADLSTGFADVSLGQIVASGGGSIPRGVAGTLTVNVFQLGADGGSGQFIGTMSGAVGRGTNTTAVSIANASPVRIGSVQYDYAPANFGAQQIMTSSGRIVTLNAHATSLAPVLAASVPEPGTVVLTASGLVAVAGFARKRRRS